ncbi:GNAT family N-acetyltransferase [Desmospora profundinema]|uniref:N-acyltransferase n=1 Tax=Desmospora profundinema TaxID=1571184 RepID=A0ABU1IIZ8_9BACL|nr:GNAT family N-acetyltransferase [Desmospora profundinema]MDR6224745.1 putative N-acyltransferase [Desmospora profundinema]
MKAGWLNEPSDNGINADEWNGFVQKVGTPFHSKNFMEALDIGWEGTRYNRHVILGENGISAVIPAYLYETCPRLDYYRHAVSPPLKDPVILSHNFVSYYGYPLAISDMSRKKVIRQFIHNAKMESAIAMMGGIDSRDEKLTADLKSNGFHLGWFHTLMIRDLTGVNKEDPTTALPHKNRHRVRNSLSLARRAGLKVRLADQEEYRQAADLIMDTVIRLGMDPEVLPRKFVHHFIHSKIPGLEVFLTLTPMEEIIGVQVGVHWRTTYYIMFAGHKHPYLNRYKQSHVLYEQLIRRAAFLGCNEIQSGRDPYPIKKQHGFTPVPLFCAVRGENPKQHERALQWLKSIEKRHIEKYGSQF